MVSANKVVCVPLIPIRHIIQFPNTDSGVYVAACKQEAFPVPRGAATHIKKTAKTSQTAKNAVPEPIARTAMPYVPHTKASIMHKRNKKVCM